MICERCAELRGANGANANLVVELRAALASARAGLNESACLRTGHVATRATARIAELERERDGLWAALRAIADAEGASPCLSGEVARAALAPRPDDGEREGGK